MSGDYRNESHLEFKDVYYTGSDALKYGYCLCYDFDAVVDPRGNSQVATALGWGRFHMVEKPSAANVGGFAGFCIKPLAAGPGWTTVARPRAGQAVDAFVQARAYIGTTLLGVTPGSYYLTPQPLGLGGFNFVACQTVNRSATAGKCQVLTLPGNSWGVETFELLDHMFQLDTALWGHTDDAGTGTNAVLDAARGWINVVTSGDDDDYHLMQSANQAFKFAASKPLFLEAIMKLTEANVDDANWVIGLTDTIATGFLQAAGAGPAAAYDGAVFFKVDGTMAISFETSNAGTQVTTASLATFVSAQEYRLGLFFDPQDGTTGYVTPFLDGAPGTPHAITLAGLEEMHAVYGLKAGGAHAETLSIDKMYVKAAA